MSTYDPLGNRIPQNPSTDPISATPNPMSDPSTLPAPELSFGQKAVGLTFNPGGSDEVNKVKQIMAIVIDEMNELRSSTTSPEVKRLCSVSITELQAAQMWCVKAITWKD